MAGCNRWHDACDLNACVTRRTGDEQVKARNINVETYKGVVPLSGFVESKTEANQAVALAEQVEGVKSVKDDLHVRQ